MSRYDAYHEPVKQALIKDGWTVTDDPFMIEYKGITLYADLGAEKPITAEKENRKIVVEVKVFGSASQISELQKAIGQYGIYDIYLKKKYTDRILYLAITQEVYQDFFSKPAVQDVIDAYEIRLIVFDLDRQEIVEWIR